MIILKAKASDLQDLQKETFFLKVLTLVLGIKTLDSRANPWRKLGIKSMPQQTVHLQGNWWEVRRPCPEAENFQNKRKKKNLGRRNERFQGAEEQVKLDWPWADHCWNRIHHSILSTFVCFLKFSVIKILLWLAFVWKLGDQQEDYGNRADEKWWCLDRASHDGEDRGCWREGNGLGLHLVVSTGLLLLVP